MPDRTSDSFTASVPDFAAGVQRSRIEQGKSIGSFSREAGIGPNALRRLEKGVTKPISKTVVQLLKALGMSYEEVVRIGAQARQESGQQEKAEAVTAVDTGTGSQAPEVASQPAQTSQPAQHGPKATHMFEISGLRIDADKTVEGAAKELEKAGIDMSKVSELRIYYNIQERKAYPVCDGKAIGKGVDL